MSTKRQPSKQKRQAQNRAQRAALEARRAAAHAAEGSDRSGSSGGRRSFFSRRSSQPPARPTTARPTGERPRGRAARAAAAAAMPIGHRAALSGLLAALAALFAVAFLLRVPVDGDGAIYTPLSRTAEWVGTVAGVAADDPAASPAEVVSAIDDWSPNAGSQTAAVAYWPFSFTFILPVIGAAIGLRVVGKRASARAVNRAVFATLFGALLTQGLFLLFLPAVISLAVAAFQIRKAELAVAREAMVQGGGGDDGVIEAEVVDDERSDPENGRLSGDGDLIVVDATDDLADDGVDGSADADEQR